MIGDDVDTGDSRRDPQRILGAMLTRQPRPLVNEQLQSIARPLSERLQAAADDPRLKVTSPPANVGATEKMRQIQDLLTQAQGGASVPDIAQHYGREWLARQGIPGEVASRVWAGEPLSTIAQSYGQGWLEQQPWYQTLKNNPLAQGAGLLYMISQGQYPTLDYTWSW